MSFLKKLFAKKEKAASTYDEFWKWFQKNEKTFFNIVRKHENIEKLFFDQLSNQLGKIRDGFFFLTGMADSNTVELIITADGQIKNIVFAEELVKAAPEIEGWKFTALKPPMPANDFNIQMAGFDFGTDNIHFYSNDLSNCPDEIDITIVHDDFHEASKSDVTNGACIFLENYLGELTFAITIDSLSVIGKVEAKKELVPIEKLSSYLTWRQKEFVEKYEGIRRDTEHDTYGTLTAELENANKLVALINTEVLKWDRKASHPWVMIIEIKYESANNAGLPDAATYDLLQEIEDELLLELKDVEGYINVGRQTAEGLREVYFACKEFRKPSKVLAQIQGKYLQTPISYNIYKDKYWQSFERFRNN